ncbi:MAG: hypothetical protein CM15mP85_31650 [Rhodobacterales bacterium]|nr:MAG: hypothetical protein CM15mP85_31650 [Rhodobacterales bacterium]
MENLIKILFSKANSQVKMIEIKLAGKNRHWNALGKSFKKFAARNPPFLKGFFSQNILIFKPGNFKFA